MPHEEMVALIQAGIPQRGGTWADFGAGSGNFTHALRELLGPEATIYAVDRDAHVLGAHDDAIIMQADFTQILTLPALDGALMTNALHWTPQQAETLALIAGYLRPSGHLIVVEYEVRWPRPHIPFPLPYARFEALAREAGFQQVLRIGERRSPSSGVTMVAALAIGG